jgi:cell division protein FtsB
MSTITEEISQKPKQREKGISFLQVLAMISLVLITAIYMGETLFGANSLEVLLSLQKQQKILHYKIKHISHENAQLQKKYLELKTVMGESIVDEQDQ